MENLLYFEELDSTQTYLKQHAASLTHGTVVCAARQTAGRGRYERSWVSQPGGLYFSLLLRPGNTPFLANLTQLMALAVCRALEELSLSPALKWPNDVQVDGQKICGILSETLCTAQRIDSLILGVGINVAQEGLEQIDQPATSLKSLGAPTDPQALLLRVLHFFWENYPALLSRGFEAIRPDYLHRFAALGKAVRVQNGTQTVFGTAQDVSARGTLVLRTERGAEEIYIGDVIL